MRGESGHILHNMTQYLLAPLIIALASFNMFPNLEKSDILITSFLGSMLPDIDHINIWLEYKFSSFNSFVKFITKARRYRYSFLIFHNIAAIAALMILIPLAARKELLAGIFLFAFLVHLLLDFADDKLSLGRVIHWRYRRKT